MTKTISAHEMRDRLLSRLKETRKSDDWVRVLSTSGHRALLTVIATEKPESIGALSERVDRAQPNVSRALKALVEAGLVEIVQVGRRSIPRATAFGLEKLGQIGIGTTESAAQTLADDEPDLFSLTLDDSLSVVDGQHRIMGTLISRLWLQRSKERCSAKATGDLSSIAARISDHWWRILYRRDAPFKLWDFSLDGEESTYSLIVNIAGASLQLSARRSDGLMLDLAHASRKLQVRALERALLDEFLSPLVSYERLRGISASPLAGRLGRLEESRNDADDTAFCRIVGALGVSPYGLEEKLALTVMRLVKEIPEEDARLDFASALLSEHLYEGEAWMREEIVRVGKQNSLLRLRSLREECSNRNSNSFKRPYHRGYALARCAREQLGLAEDSSVGGVEGLSQLLGAENGISLSREAPGSLRAIQTSEDGDPLIVIEDEGPLRSAFVLARAVGDYLEFGGTLSCVADLYTDRQAVGRSFAAEFMAPSSAVVEMIENEDLSTTQIAEHFGVSPTVIQHQYQNSAAVH